MRRRSVKHEPSSLLACRGASLILLMRIRKNPILDNHPPRPRRSTGRGTANNSSQPPEPIPGNAVILICSSYPSPATCVIEVGTNVF